MFKFTFGLACAAVAFTGIYMVYTIHVRIVKFIEYNLQDCTCITNTQTIDVEGESNVNSNSRLMRRNLNEWYQSNPTPRPTRKCF